MNADPKLDDLLRRLADADQARLRRSDAPTVTLTEFVERLTAAKAVAS